MPLADRVPETAASPRWLSIVGIGEDGVEGLGANARGLIGAADIVLGGKRHLALAAPLIRGAARPWPSPFDAAADEVLRSRGRRVCVLASGDPFLYGVGATYDWDPWSFGLGWTHGAYEKATGENGIGPFNADHDIYSATVSYELADGISVDGVTEYSDYRSHDPAGPDYRGLALGLGTLIEF